MWAEKNNQAIKSFTARPKGILRGGGGSVYLFSASERWYLCRMYRFSGFDRSSGMASRLSDTVPLGRSPLAQMVFYKDFVPCGTPNKYRFREPTPPLKTLRGALPAVAKRVTFLLRIS